MECLRPLTGVKGAPARWARGLYRIGTRLYILVYAFLAVEVTYARRTRCSSTVRMRRPNHSPQGVETGDFRSSRHMPQVNSDMPSVARAVCG